MQTTLLLNASYEPIGGICIQRAVVLVLTGRAELVEAGDGYIRSPSTELPRPAVIRLLRYVSRAVRRTRPPAASRRAILARDNHTCQYCGEFGDTIDHVVPRARGGVTSWTNCVAACVDCNATKGDRTLAQLGWKLAREPKAPSAAVVRLRPELPSSTPELWEPYLQAWVAG